MREVLLYRGLSNTLLASQRVTQRAVPYIFMSMVVHILSLDNYFGYSTQIICKRVYSSSLR